MADAPRGAPPPAGWRRSMPWYDAAGRFSAFKVAVLVLLCLPAAWIAYRLGAGLLGPRPLNAAVHLVGNWTLRILLISLAVRPARSLLQWPRVMQVRRMVGVAAFAYAVAHLALYAADEAFDLRKVATEIVLRIYLAIGFVALLILTALAATSTDGMARRLGGRRWRRLHQLVYAAALLAVVHFFMQTKVSVDEPWVMAGLFAWLMAYRLMDRPGRTHGGVTAVRALFLGIGSAVATALGEALYYWIKLGAPPARVLAANLAQDMGLRPSLVVAAICCGAAIVAMLRQWYGRAAR